MACRHINTRGMIDMNKQVTGIAVAAMLSFGASLPGYAEDAAKPADSAAPAAVKTEAPANVARPSIAPKTAEPAATPTTAEPAPRRHRRNARHHYRRYAYWEPFPIYLPHFYRHRIHWNRISWFAF
jgi:hypothetical protein